MSCTVDREIFAFKYFCVINVRVSNFHHKVQEVKIFFNGEYFPIYGTCTDGILFIHVHLVVWLQYKLN